MPQLKPTRGIRLNRGHPLSRGLAGYWLFNEGSGNKAFDLSGNGNDGTIVGAIWSSGKFGSAISLPGTDEYVNVPDKDILDMSAALSIVALINPTVVNSADSIVSKYDSLVLANQRSWALTINNTGLLRFAGTDNGTSANYWSVTTNNTVISANLWQTVAVVYSGANTNVDLHVNGVEKASSVDVKPVTSSLHIGTAPLDIGAAHSGTANYFPGKIGYVMIFNRALSASEIALLYREPFCMFDRVWRPGLIDGQIVELAGTSTALSSLSAIAKASRKVGGTAAGTSDVAAQLNSIRSLLEVERDWLREALFNGMTANAFKLGTTLSLGWFWVRVAGCSVLYRGSSMGEIDFVNILAVAEKNALEISPSSYISHNSSSTYFYVVRRFNNCGYQERTLAASVKVSIESNGELAEPQPNKVFDSGAELVDGNKIQLVWYYCLLEQKSQPMRFNVYYDGRTGQIDYENPLAIISYKGRKFYSYQSGALEAGRYLFAIRTEDASGIENSSLARLRIQFNTTNPNAIDILSVEGV
ncbi:MAG: LamG domain-containing protein [Planctomycetota bacterium]